ncbi:hypothetical protein [Aureibacter tunicatorum]|uniref:Uncharacterized protein n=1 Tax=Aureibacter tunicatorum TaxID=866807 RepID=A0AAE4BSY1_9BACT|nr:hypothetical protein [Aureibacter tunicatorum]MDR6241659.1 hypothetical protein [Aureibacter tunicatorum]BDD07355.1 hypothetical protein AUTU_48380 [Aureibacter tunicatorum]
MSLLNRKTLKSFFRKGNIPTEVNFSDLIDSSVNKVDDGFSKSSDDGLQVSTIGDSDKLVSFYENIKDLKANWSFVMNPKNQNKGFGLRNLNTDKISLFIRDNNYIGVGTMSPKSEMDIRGALSVESLIGNFAQGTIPADGQWHTVIPDLSEYSAFEIMAKASGPKGRGKYVLAHVNAVCAYGARNGSIKINQSYYGWPFNRIKARWVGGVNEYHLQLKTASHFGLSEEGNPYELKYFVTNLYDKRCMQ